ncbi:MAG: HlyD family efflux transporter periplasmic adaptor subunit [Candidatus Latescibacterota bacterium]|nr:MAG: HlyD family efflux transporter periplasmic adaptor subunit [Candidatus Latescibacterota bacterium]
MRAPFLGRVREKLVDVGQSVVPGQPLAHVYAIDYAEVRLPVPDEDLAFVDLPMTHRREAAAGAREAMEDPRPRVILRTRFAGGTYEWHGHVVRTEGEIDPQSRMVHVVAQVENPYGRREDPNHPPLAAGLFVHADIMGHLAADVVVVPRAAMRGRDELLVIDEEERIRFRHVEVLRSERERVLIRGGLREGERVCLSPLEAVTDGMRVRATETEPDPPRLQREPAESPQPDRAASHAKRTDASAEPEVAP